MNKSGFEGVNVSFQNAEVSLIPKSAGRQKSDSISEAINLIEELGFQVVDDTDVESRGRSTEEKLLIIGVVCSIPLLLSMVPAFEWLRNPLVQFGLCLPVMVTGWWYFFKSAWRSLQTGVPNMDVLIALGSGAAFFYSVAGWAMGLGHDYLFFETAATIVTLVLLGKRYRGEVGKGNNLRSPRVV